MEKKTKGGAEKLRIKKMVNLQAVANDPKQTKISFKSVATSNRLMPGKYEEFSKLQLFQSTDSLTSFTYNVFQY